MFRASDPLGQRTGQGNGHDRDFQEQVSRLCCEIDGKIAAFLPAAGARMAVYLAGRDLIPLMGPDGRSRPHQLHEAADGSNARIEETVDVVHGNQQLSLFNAHYDDRCFLPIRLYDTATSRPVAVPLRHRQPFGHRDPRSLAPTGPPHATYLKARRDGRVVSVAVIVAVGVNYLKSKTQKALDILGQAKCTNTEMHATIQQLCQ